MAKWITAWHITQAPYQDTALSGEGAKRYGGRFNSVGVPVVYTAESISLATLEVPGVVEPMEPMESMESMESNYLINPLHPDHEGLEIGDPTPLRLDARLLDD